jgi:excisionase family DNA binding protein
METADLKPLQKDEWLLSCGVGQAQSQPLTVRPAQMAKMLGVSERTLKNWMAQRGLPFIKIGRAVLLDPRAVMKWLQSVNETNPTVAPKLPTT